MRRSTVISVATIVALVGSRADAAPVIAFGDSWGQQSAPQLEAALMAAGHNLTVANIAQGGRTAAYYAITDPTYLVNNVTANPDAEWVYLSLGGNDVIDHYTMGGVGTTAAMNEMNLTAILNGLFAVHPDIRVIMFGYDRTNYVQDMSCQALADTTYGMGTTQAQINMIYETEIGAVMANVASNFPNVHYVPLWGTLQAAAGVTVTPNDPSPAMYFTDCFHLTPAGYRIMHDALVAAYWSAEPPVTASFDDDGTARCVGNTITFTDRSTNATQGRWLVDAVAAGTADTLGLPLMTTGAVDVERRALNRVWSDATSQTIVVSSCVDGGLPDAGEIDGGTNPMDGGPADGAMDPDGGMVRDGGPPRDAGPQRDAGPRDGGFVQRDGGTLATGTWNLSGGCTAAPGRSGAFVFLIGALILFVLRRRH